MASNNKWIHRVLFKLNELFLNGSDFDDRRWIFDWDDKLKLSTNLDNVWDEDRALETLTKAGVIESRSLVNRYRDEVLSSIEKHGKYATVYGDWHTTDPAHREYEYERWLDGFNYKNFQRFCELHGFNPSSEGVTATLELLSDVIPTVEAEGQRYRLQTLGAGTITQEIVAFAAKNFDKELSLGELQQAINARQLTNKGINISQLFRKNIFSPNKTLSKFAVISPKSFMLKQKVLLTPGEVEEIRKTSTR